MIQKYYIYSESNQTEICFYILCQEDTNFDLIKNILSRNGKYHITKNRRLLSGIEIGPRVNFKTAWCNTMLEIFLQSDIKGVDTIEYSIKYRKNEDIRNYDKMLFTQYSDTYFENSYSQDTIINDNIRDVDIVKYNREEGLGMDDMDIVSYQKLFKELCRGPTNVELYDLSQCNSEHARHWYFKGQLSGIAKSLFDRIKSCYNISKHLTSLVSFYDNASVVKGGYTQEYIISKTLRYEERLLRLHYSYKAETHNFPTGISPFPGAATGSGGRIRDLLCVGKGGELIAGTAGYCVGDIFGSDKNYDFVYHHPINILIDASNGASDYGNKIGEPLIQGFTRSFRQDTKDNRRIEWLKPIMFSGGMGKIIDYNIKKKKPQVGHLIVRIGGPAYRIGIGGGSASSRTQDNLNRESDFNAVQRGDPLMANKIAKFLQTVSKKNIIISIHDQGSGGMANVTREICEDKGADVFLDDVLLGDNTLTSLEKWVAEYQEQVTLLVDENNILDLEKIAEREKVSLRVVGKITDSKKLNVYTDHSKETKVVSLPMEETKLTKFFNINPSNDIIELVTNTNTSNKTIMGMLEDVFKLVEVGSKQFLTNKVDRSVSGLILQQQCVGPFHLPLSNLSAVKSSFSSETILVSAIGEQPIKGITGNIKDMVYLTVGEMLTNIIWCELGSLRKINTVANWMWASTSPEDGWLLNEAVDALVECSNELEFSINGGKDSLSMKVKHEKQEIKAPNTLVLSGYGTTKYQYIITPNLQGPNNLLFLVRLEDFTGRLGGSAYSRCFSHSNLETPTFRSFSKFKLIYSLIQELISNQVILSGHDISDGGLLTTLCEMSFSSIYGINIDIKSDFSKEEYLFSEELGIVFEISPKKLSYVHRIFLEKKIELTLLGATHKESEIRIKYNGDIIMDEKNEDVRYNWQKTSYMLELKQANPKCIEEEVHNCYSLKDYNYYIPSKIETIIQYNFFEYRKCFLYKPKIAILRAEGSNGEKEMTNCFYEVGFDCYDITLNDIIQGRINLRKFRGIAFVGGFTYSDVLGSAYGWYSMIQNNDILQKELTFFYEREDTFSLGICNGCQLMSLLGWIPKGISLEENISGRFESRWSKVKIIKNNSIFFKDMEDLVFGIYTAHGEGRIVSRRKQEENIFPVRYVDSDNSITEKYPFNPNGSENGRAAISSLNGRHLAIMPHPERVTLGWQLPMKYQHRFSPWMFMFKNVYEWCCE